LCIGGYGISAFRIAGNGLLLRRGEKAAALSRYDLYRTPKPCWDMLPKQPVLIFPQKKWTGLSCFSLHLDRADIADGGVATGSVVVSFDVDKDIAFGFFSCRILTVMDELGFERVEEAFHRRIVVAVGLAAHRGLEAGGLRHLAAVRRGILDASIGMVDQAGAWPLR